MVCEDIEKLRKPWEIEDHWILRRDFMIANKEFYSYERLQCLAQTFVNVEILGATYDDAIMEEIKIASNRVESLPEFRSKKKELSQEERFKPPPKKAKSGQLGTRNVAGHSYFNNQQQIPAQGYNNNSGNQYGYQQPRYQQQHHHQQQQQQQHSNRPYDQQQRFRGYQQHSNQGSYGHVDPRSNYYQGYNQAANSQSYYQQPQTSYSSNYGSQGYNYNQQQQQQPRYGLQSSYAPRHNYNYGQGRNQQQQYPYQQHQSSKGQSQH